MDRSPLDSEEKYRAVFETSPDLLYTLSPNGKILECNDMMLKTLGYSRDELIGMKLLNLYADESKSYARECFKESLKTGKLRNKELKIVTKDGKKIDVELNLNTIYDSKGKAIYSISSQRDITRRKQMEKALISERNKLINILDSTEDGIYIANQNYDIEYINLVLKKEFGPIKGRKCYKYFHGRKKVCPWCKNQEVIKGKTVRWEWYSFKNHRTYELVDIPLKNSDGSVSKLEIFRDVTERKKIEESLRLSEERYALAQRHAKIGTWDWNIQTGDLTWSEQIELIFGFGRGEFGATYKAFLECVHPEDRQYVIDSVNDCIEEGKDYDIEHRILWSDGNIHWVLETGNVIRDKTGKAIRMLGIVRDITRRKEMEKELIQKKEEIERGNKELENRVEESIKKIQEAEKLALVGKLSAGIVHEINNPLYGISNYIELLLDEEEKEERNRHLKMISQGIDIIKSVTSNLLDLSQLGKLNLERVNINKLLEEVLSFSMPNIQKAKVKTVVQTDKNIPDILLDKNKIKEVFLNLITNAREAMPDGGKLKVRSKLGDKKVNIYFSDTGVGIPDEKVKHVFEPFHSDKRKQGKRGVGLGLFMVSNIVSIHNGEIKVKSAENKGTTVEIILPVNV